MDQQDEDRIIHRVGRWIAAEYGCTIENVNAVLGRHPIEVDRDKYLKRALALQLLHLDKLEKTFRDKALVDRDVASGVCVFIGQSPAFEGKFANARKPAPRRAW